MAIDDPLNELEQSERVRSWLKKNGFSLASGVVLGIAVLLGWQWWGNKNAHEMQQANVHYEGLLQQIENNDLDAAALELANLEKGKVDVYGVLAALTLAKAQVEAGDNEQALVTLKGLKPDAELKPWVDLRVARLLIETDKAQEAISLLAEAKGAVAFEVRGDAYMALDDMTQAQAAYNQALTLLDVASPKRQPLELKLADAGGTPSSSVEQI